MVRITRDDAPLNEGNTPLATGASRVHLTGNRLEVLEKGAYRIELANGRTLEADQPAPLDPLAITGPWKVDFLEIPGLGTPFAATYPTLDSWTNSDQRAEKYFSGTARYTTSFTLDPSDLAKNRRAYLDLGYVGDTASIRLNGRELGVLWKAPYLSEVTGSLKAGPNILEVAVTNLWINRLIGDLQLPRDERRTYTNVLEKPNKFTKRLFGPGGDNYLRTSGLIGPVKIRFSQLHEIGPWKNQTDSLQSG